ncbi:hypothetical protein THIX_10023 [Thiomonas sp. X19]|nr:hypothetical protein THIX_10023 [Thiomonas sp. X19]
MMGPLSLAAWPEARGYASSPLARAGVPGVLGESAKDLRCFNRGLLFFFFLFRESYSSHLAHVAHHGPSSTLTATYAMSQVGQRPGITRHGPSLSQLAAPR